MKKTLIIIASVIVLSVAITFVANLISEDDDAENSTPATANVVDTNTTETTTAVTLQNRADVTITTFDYFTTTTLSVIDEIRNAEYPNIYNRDLEYDITGHIGDSATNLSIGLYHTCGIGFQIKFDNINFNSYSDDLVQCWGNGSFGQLGIRINNRRGLSVPDAYKGTDIVVKNVAAGNNFTCLVTDIRTEVQCWGHNGQRQLGYELVAGDKFVSYIPNIIKGFINVKNIFATGASNLRNGFYRSSACVIDRVSQKPNEDVVKCWGSNVSGTLGILPDGLYGNSAQALTVEGSEGVRDLSIGGGHICSIVFDYTVKCWGENKKGQLGQPLNVQNSNIPLEVNGISGVVDIASGENHTCVIAIQNNVDRGVWCWGANNFGQLANSHTTLINSFAPIRIGNITGAKSISGHSNSICITTASRNIQCWGLNGADTNEQFHGSTVSGGGTAEKLFESISDTHPENIGITQGLSESWVTVPPPAPSIIIDFQYIKTPTILPVVDFAKDIGSSFINGEWVRETETIAAFEDVYELVVGDRRACALNSKLVITCFGFQFSASGNRESNGIYGVPSP